MTTVGLDLGGTKCLGLAVDADNNILERHRVPTPKGDAAILDAMAEVARELQGRVGDVSAVGVGAPGLVDRDGVLRVAPNLPGVFDLAIRAELERRLSVAVHVDNDASCAAWGERELGAARSYDDVILVTLGTGIGGGIVADGHLYRGANGFGAEMGHMVVCPDGPPCSCGQRGCWEQYASGNGLGRLGRDAVAAGEAPRLVELAGSADAVRGQHVVQAATEGDAGAKTVIERFAWWLARGLANLANIFDPQAFVVGGGLVAAGDVILAPTREVFPGLVMAADHRPEIPIVPAQLGEDAGAIGAATVARVRAAGG